MSTHHEAGASERLREALDKAISQAAMLRWEEVTISATTARDLRSALATAPEPNLDGAFRLALIQIEHDGEVIKRLEQALRVATHHPHDQAGEPNEGFPVCSVCGAIQTAPAPAPDSDLLAAVEAVLRKRAREAGRAVSQRTGSHIEYDRGRRDAYEEATTAVLALLRSVSPSREAGLDAERLPAPAGYERVQHEDGHWCLHRFSPVTTEQGGSDA